MPIKTRIFKALARYAKGEWAVLLRSFGRSQKTDMREARPLQDLQRHCLNGIECVDLTVYLLLPVKYIAIAHEGGVLSMQYTGLASQTASGGARIHRSKRTMAFMDQGTRLHILFEISVE